MASGMHPRPFPRDAADPRPSLSRAVSRWTARALLAAKGDPPVEFALWNGESARPTQAPAAARVRIGSPRVLADLVRRGDLAFGDAYTSGELTIEGDLVGALEVLLDSSWRDGVLGRLALRYRMWRDRSNSLRGSRDNIHHHYDLGNDFYALWLDREMAYTCAYFATPEASLEEAQVAKFEHVSRKLRLRTGESVVEAGCGWGGLALHMARHHGVRVRAFNISQEQVRFARERAAREGLADRVEFVAEDYREIRGRYDAFVSVGMLEHVGRDHYRDLGRVVHRCLGSAGRGLLHSLGRPRPYPMNAWMVRRIFPGAYSPALSEIAALLEPWSFAVTDVENLRLHYARTCEHWLERFEKHAAEIARRFDERFVRAWRLYLAGSIAAFRTGSFHLFQVVFAPIASRDVAWTRAHLYRD